MKYCLVSLESWELILQFVSSGLTKLDETIGYCWCPIVMRWWLWLQQWSLCLHHCDVIHWDKQSCVTMVVVLLTFNLCVYVTWPLTCAFHIPCTHTPEIIDMHRGVCDNGCFTALDNPIITTLSVTKLWKISVKYTSTKLRQQTKTKHWRCAKFWRDTHAHHICKYWQ